MMEQKSLKNGKIKELRVFLTIIIPTPYKKQDYFWPIKYSFLQEKIT